MDESVGYAQFCPVAMASELLCTRWTALVVRELLAGSRRFNELRQGVARMSPALLSKRLKELERAGVIVRTTGANGAPPEYLLTQAGRDLRPFVEALGLWGQRWVEARATLRRLDPSLLMWDMRRNLDPTPLPPARRTIQFRYPELAPPRRCWWVVVEPGAPVDVCSVDPGFEVDLYVVSTLRSMTAIWMGLATVKGEVEAGNLELVGDPQLKDSMQTWLGLSPFAKEPKLAAA